MSLDLEILISGARNGDPESEDLLISKFFRKNNLEYIYSLALEISNTSLLRKCARLKISNGELFYIRSGEFIGVLFPNKTPGDKLFSHIPFEMGCEKYLVFRDFSVPAIWTKKESKRFSIEILKPSIEIFESAYKKDFRFRKFYKLLERPEEFSSENFTESLKILNSLRDMSVMEKKETVYFSILALMAAIKNDSYLVSNCMLRVFLLSEGAYGLSREVTRQKELMIRLYLGET